MKVEENKAVQILREALEKIQDEEHLVVEHVSADWNDFTTAEGSSFHIRDILVSVRSKRYS